MSLSANRSKAIPSFLSSDSNSDSSSSYSYSPPPKDLGSTRRRTRSAVSRKSISHLFGPDQRPPLPYPPLPGHYHAPQDISTEVSVESGKPHNRTKTVVTTLRTTSHIRRPSAGDLSCGLLLLGGRKGQLANLANFDDIIGEARLKNSPKKSPRTLPNPLQINIQVEKEEWSCKPEPKPRAGDRSWRWSRQPL